MKANHWFYGQPHGFHDPHQIERLLKQETPMIEPRDRDGFLAKDRPQDIPQQQWKPSAHEAALQDALNERDGLAYQAIGVLRALLVTGELERALGDAREISNRYDAINDKLVAILASKKS